MAVPHYSKLYGILSLWSCFAGVGAFIDFTRHFGSDRGYFNSLSGIDDRFMVFPALTLTSVFAGMGDGEYGKRDATYSPEYLWLFGVPTYIMNITPPSPCQLAGRGTRRGHMHFFVHGFSSKQHFPG